jgi:WD40 repeat protein
MTNKFALRTYTEHKADLTSVNFSPNKKDFVSAGNETMIKLWNVLEH